MHSHLMTFGLRQVLVLLAGGWSGAVMLASGADPASSAYEQAGAEIRAAVEAGAVAGVSLLVMHQGEVVVRESVGLRDAETGAPLTPDTIVRIYSMTKPIVSVAAMILNEQGRFALDDPVGAHLPAFGKTFVLEREADGFKTVPARRPITVRDVLRHTTGYSYGDDPPEVRALYEKEGLRYGGPYEMMPPQMTIAEAADALARIPAHHHPGERFTYGFSTDLLGRLIEVWTGESLDVALRRLVLDPLGMRDTGFSVPEGKRHRFASCHASADGRLVVVDRASESPFAEGFAFLSGGGGLVSTADDYARFCRMLIDGGVFRGARLLEAETLRQMFTDQLGGVAGDFRFGLGFAIKDVALGSGDARRTATEYSWGGYASTAFHIVPDEKLAIIVVRQHVPMDPTLADRLFRIVYDGVRG